MTPRRPSVVRFLAIALVVPILLIAASTWLGWEYQITEQMRLEARAAYDRRVEASGLIARIVDAETGERGFVITGDQHYLADYEPAKSEVLRVSTKLRAELASDRQQADLLERFHNLVIERFRDMDGVIAERRAGGIEAAVRAVQANKTKHLMEKMRAVSAQMVKIGERDRNSRVDSYRARVEADRVGLWIGIGSVGAFLLIAAFLFWRQEVARYHARIAAFSVAERNRSILDSTIDAIAFLNPDGTIETINSAATSMLGYRADELAGRDISVLIELLDRPISFHERIGLIDGQLANPYLPDRRIIHRDGHEIPVDIAMGVIRLPDGDHIVASVRDISQRKQIERMKDDLMSTVSHELRTPLTSVIGALGLLRAGAAGTLPDRAAQLVEVAENNSSRLIRLINDMLDIDRMKSGRLPLDRQPIDMADAVRTACEGSSGLAAAAGIEIDCVLPDDPVLVLGDAGRLVQVITNLTSNAIRVSPAGGTVAITLTADQRTGRASLTVDDDGPGIPAEFRERVFGRFERADDEQGTGTGLGLAISSEIVTRHDGTIWFEDRPKGGTRFAFKIDLLRDSEIAGGDIGVTP